MGYFYNKKYRSVNTNTLGIRSSSEIENRTIKNNKPVSIKGEGDLKSEFSIIVIFQIYPTCVSRCVALQVIKGF